MSKLFRDIDTLKFDPANSRKHDERNIKAIMESLKQHGQRKPIVIYSDMVVAGNGTLEAAKRLGWTEIWVNNDPFPSLEAAKAYALQDNRSAELAAWDDVQLGDTLAELKDAGYDLDGLGWNEGDLKEIMSDKSGTEGLTDPDEVPEVDQNEFGVKRGDIWQLGNHRIMCGDSTIKEDVEKLMNGEKADMVFTDPPYGIEVVSTSTDGGSKSFGTVGSKGVVEANKYAPIIGDETTETAKSFYKLSQDLGIKNFLIWGGNYFTDFLPPKKCWIVWDKKGREWDDNFSDFEMAWSSFDKPAKIFTHVWMGMVQSGEREKRVHPTQKPSNLVSDCLDYLGGNHVYDAFLGSGSTLIACEKTGRKCYGMELDEHYCSVIIKRWQDFTGKKAEKIVEGT